MLSDPDTDNPGWLSRPITRYRSGEALAADDRIAQECPVALVFNGISHAVMMCSPRDLESFAVGFALTEGIVQRGSDIQDIEVEYRVEGPRTYAAVSLTIVQRAFVDLKEKRRALTGRTGCGVCGIESIDLLDLVPERVTDTGFLTRLAPDAIARAAHALPAHQTLMRATGGVHAAAWCDAEGAIDQVFEDVGRHNAMDKLLGALTLQRKDLSNGFVFLSSRASYELIRKAARMNVPMVATISAPSSLAVSIAEQAGIRLVSFCRENGYVEYQPGPAQSN